MSVLCPSWPVFHALGRSARKRSPERPTMALMLPGGISSHCRRRSPPIEVADTSLEPDRGIKLALYAAGGIPMVCVLDLPAGPVLGVLRGPADFPPSPREDAGVPSGSAKHDIILRYHPRD